VLNIPVIHVLSVLSYRAAKIQGTRAGQQHEHNTVQDDKSSGSSSSDSNTDGEEGHLLAGATRIKYRKTAERKLYSTALNEWLDNKYNSPECEHLDITKDWILSSKDISNMARHPALTSTQSLATLRPPWMHLERWGAEVLQVLAGVTERLEAQTEQKRLDEDAKRLAAEEKAQTLRMLQEQQVAERQRKMTEALQATSAPNVPKKRRRPLPSDATEEQKQARRDEVAAEKRHNSQRSYWKGQAEEQLRKKAKIEPTDTQDTPQAIPSSTVVPQAQLRSPASPSTPLAGPSHLPTVSTPFSQHIITFSAKEELVDDQDRLLGSGRTCTTSRNMHIAALLPIPSPLTPLTPQYPRTFNFEVQTQEQARNQFQPPTPLSQPINQPKKPQIALPQEHTEATPSVPRVRCRPIIKSKAPEEKHSPPQ
jgi:hypothetical protein